MNVKNCVIVSNIPFNAIKKCQMRFLATCDLTCEQVINLLLKDDRIENMSCAKKDDGTFCGYGFIQLKNNNDYNNLKKQQIIIDNILFYFD